MRTIGEDTLKKSLESVKDFDVEIVYDYRPFELAVKKMLGIGTLYKDKYDWMLGFDADCILQMSKDELLKYIKKMERQDIFCFSGWLKCTKRGLISGLHFYNLQYIDEIYNFISQIDLSYCRGREEYNTCKLVQDNLKLKWTLGSPQKSMGKHIWQTK